MPVASLERERRAASEGNPGLGFAEGLGIL